MVQMTLTACFSESFLRHAERTALSFLRNGRVETMVTYDGLHHDANRMARLFGEMGVKQGDRVILYLPKSVFFVIAHTALQKMGAISVPLNPGFKASEMAYFLDDASPALVVAGVEQAQVIGGLAGGRHIVVVDTERPYQELALLTGYPDEPVGADIRPDDPGLIIYTSGTTGKPKGAVLTQGNLAHDAQNIIQIWAISSGDVLCHALPFFHVHGLCFALHTLMIAGGQTVTIDRFDAEGTVHILADRARFGCTLFMAVPAMYSKMVAQATQKGLDFSHIRLWTSGSAPLLPKDFERIKAIFGKAPVEREGMSETGMNFSNPLNGVRKPGSIGLPLPGLRYRIVDPETMQDVFPGKEGEIWLKGPGITPGYWQKPEETAEAFEQGWFRTGDLARVDEDGYLFLTDRIKHIIISGGENISPKEIEGIINQMAGVQESSVVGIPDDKWGEKVIAAVVKSSGKEVTPQAVIQHCKRNLHDWKCPKSVHFVSALPKNAMGKVLKDEVKALFS